MIDWSGGNKGGHFHEMHAAVRGGITNQKPKPCSEAFRASLTACDLAVEVVKDTY